MIPKSFIFIFIFLGISLTSCKDDKKKDAIQNQTEESIEEDDGIRKPIVNNIFSKIEATSELTLMGNILDSLQLKDELIFEEGPFTIFAVKDEVFNSFLKRDSLFSAISENKEEWKNIMTTYILEEQLSSVSMFQNIKKNGGVFHAETSSGKHLKFYLIENDIIVEGPKGLISKIGKSDILGTNGVVHIIDNLIGSH